VPREPDPATLALIRRLCAEGIIGQADVDAIANDLDERGKPDAAHAVRCEFIQAIAPSESEWQAERRRSRFEIVPPDGGNA
jgi:hypothetical protein